MAQLAMKGAVSVVAEGGAGVLFLFFFSLSLSSLTRRRLKMQDFTCFVGLAYKSSLRDSIFRWSPRGKNATSDVIRP